MSVISKISLLLLFIISEVMAHQNHILSGGDIMKEGSFSANQKAELMTAIFAGGCFWCMEERFSNVEGVVDVTSGYTGGNKENPTYEEVSTGNTGHYEAIEVRYDPKRVSYRKLLEVFWRFIDPTDSGGQFFDRGSQYRTAIFYLNKEQQRLAELSKQRLETSGIFDKPIATCILRAGLFYPAEEYHQDFYKKNPGILNVQ